MMYLYYKTTKGRNFRPLFSEIKVKAPSMVKFSKYLRKNFELVLSLWKTFQTLFGPKKNPRP